jgi:hypothetical protein
VPLSAAFAILLHLLCCLAILRRGIDKSRHAGKAIAMSKVHLKAGKSFFG